MHVKHSTMDGGVSTGELCYLVELSKEIGKMLPRATNGQGI